MNDADRAALDALETRVLPLLERKSSLAGDDTDAAAIRRDVEGAVATLRQCLQVRERPLKLGEPPVIVNANIMRRAQDAQRRLEAVMEAMDDGRRARRDRLRRLRLGGQ